MRRLRIGLVCRGEEEGELSKLERIEASVAKHEAAEWFAMMLTVADARWLVNAVQAARELVASEGASNPNAVAIYVDPGAWQRFEVALDEPEVLE